MEQRETLPRMHFKEPVCPDCGLVATGTLDRIEGIAEFLGDPDPREGFDYSGSTEVLWDTQETQTDPAGGSNRWTLVDEEGHTWHSEVVHAHERPADWPPVAGTFDADEED